MIHLLPHAAATDANGDEVRLGDEVFHRDLGRDYPATVVRIIGGWRAANVEIEYVTGVREQHFGCDVVRVAA